MFQVEKELTKLLSQLIQVDTTNPPGNETQAAELLKDWLADRGVDSQVLESENGRGSLIATIGDGEPSLLLLSHLDVVPTNPEEWKIHPFSGEIKDGYVWGRGALDCKSLVAIEAYLTAEFASRENWSGKIVFAATADEEMGGKKGVGWIVENRPELLKTSYGINEGGGLEMPGKKGSVFTVQVAEKGVYWLVITFKGEPGHASMPLMGDNALVKASKFIQDLTEKRPRVTPTETAKRFIKDLADTMGLGPLAPLLLNPLTADLALASFKDKKTAAMIDAILRNTLTPTMLNSGTKENIIPSKATLIVDARLLPGFDEKWLQQYLDKLLPPGAEIRFIHKDPPSQSPTDTGLYKAIQKAINQQVPGAKATPFLVPGGTDSRYIRWKYNTPIYGFQPIRADQPVGEILAMIHGINEKISVKNLVFGYTTLKKTLEIFFKQETKHITHK